MAGPPARRRPPRRRAGRRSARPALRRRRSEPPVAALAARKRRRDNPMVAPCHRRSPGQRGPVGFAARSRTIRTAMSDRRSRPARGGRSMSEPPGRRQRGHAADDSERPDGHHRRTQPAPPDQPDRDRRDGQRRRRCRRATRSCRWLPKVRMANDFSHSGVRSMNVLPDSQQRRRCRRDHRPRRVTDAIAVACGEHTAHARRRGASVAAAVLGGRSSGQRVASRWRRLTTGCVAPTPPGWPRRAIATRLQCRRSMPRHRARASATLTATDVREGERCGSRARSRSSPVAAAGWAGWPPRCSRPRAPRSSSPSTARRPGRRPWTSSGRPAARRPSSGPTSRRRPTRRRWSTTPSRPTAGSTASTTTPGSCPRRTTR